MEIYEVYDKNAGPDDVAICHCFTEQGAQVEIERQAAQKSRDCAYRMITPRCRWGAAYSHTWCQREATWFSPDFAGPVCDEHYRPDWSTHRRMVRREEMARIELGQAKLPAPVGSQTSFGLQER